MLKNVFFSENRAVHEIMWENIVVPDRPQMIIWRTRIACWTPKAKKPLIIYNYTHHTSTIRMFARTRLSVVLYAHCLSCSLLWLSRICSRTLWYFAITFMLSRTVAISDPCCDVSRYFQVPVTITHHMYDVTRQ